VAETVSDTPPFPGGEWLAEQLPCIPGYEVRGVLGKGGMGVVYHAWHVPLQRAVALKMIRARADSAAADPGRFRLEAEAVARVRHPNIVQIYETGEHEGAPYFALEYVEGGSLAQKAAGTPLPPRQAAELVQTLARAMHAAHQAGIVHRDLKPANVLLTADGQPKIGDFGLAKKLEEDSGRTRSGDVLGTPSYMAPEQAQGHSKDSGPLVDVYALGAILYELLTGRPPFRAATVLETLEQVCNDDPVPPSRLQPRCPRDLQTVCLKCLEKEPQRRYRDASALADDLGRFLDGRPVLARRASLLERSIKWGRRRPAAAALALVSALAALGLLGSSLWYNGRLRAERNRAVRGEDQARRSLEVARSAADALVTELAESIKPLAGTQSPTVEKILARAARVYDDLLAQEESSPVLEAKAGMLNAFADIYLELNDSARALASAREAGDLFDRLHQADPENLRLLAGLARSHQMAGRVLHEQGHLETAQQELEKSIALSTRLTERDAEDPRWQAQLAFGYNFLANVLWEEDDPAAGKNANEAAYKLRARLVERDPADRQRRRELAHSREKVGDFQFEENHLAEAREAYQDAARIYQNLLAKDPAFTDVARNLTRARQSIGDVYHAQGESTQALAEYQQALRTAEPFARQDPANVQWQRLVLGCRLNIGKTKGTANPAVLREKLEILQAILAPAEQAGRRDPTRVRWRSDLAEVHLSLGRVHAALAGMGSASQEHQTQALAAYQTAAQALEEVERQAPTYVPAIQLLAEVYQALGKLRQEQKEPVAAQEAYLRSWRSLLAGSQRCAVAFAGNPKWRRQQAECRREIAAHLAQLAELGVSPREKLTQAAGELDASAALYEEFYRREAGQQEWRTELVEAYRTLSKAFQAHGMKAEAATATARIEALAGPQR
jgi:serine/threonine-protein kinase